MSLATTPNQFTDQLGYLIASLTSSYTVNIASADTWTIMGNGLTEISTYNTDVYRDKMMLSIAGIWKIDVSFTVNGATNDDLQFCLKYGDSAYQHPVIWNAKGGNNWNINYSMIIKTEIQNETIYFYMKNETATNNPVFFNGIFSAIKLY